MFQRIGFADAESDLERADYVVVGLDICDLIPAYDRGEKRSWRPGWPGS